MFILEISYHDLFSYLHGFLVDMFLSSLLNTKKILNYKITERFFLSRQEIFVLFSENVSLFLFFGGGGSFKVIGKSFRKEAATSRLIGVIINLKLTFELIMGYS